MKLTFLSVAIFFSLNTFGQKKINIGQGILHIDFEKLPTVMFFTDTTQKSPTKSITVTKDKEGEFVIKNNSQVTQWFKPEGLW